MQRLAIAPQGPEFSRFVMGYWRLMDWGMSPQSLVTFIEQHLELGITTVDHADIYGDYQCESAFGSALKLHLRYAKNWRSSLNAVLPRWLALAIRLVTTLLIKNILLAAPKTRYATSPQTTLIYS